MQTFLRLIDATEGAGNYDTLFGHSQRSGPFVGMQVSQMRLGDLAKFSDPSGEYGRWVAQQTNGPIATPMGRYQIVGKTLRGAAQELGLGDDVLFNQHTQDQIAGHLATRRLAGAQTQDQKRAALRAEWHGLRNVSDAEVDAAIAEIEGGGMGALTMSTKGSLGPDPNQPPVTPLEPPAPILQSVLPTPTAQVVSDGSEQIELIQQGQDMAGTNRRAERSQPLIDIIPSAAVPPSKEGPQRGGAERGRGRVVVTSDPEVRGSRYRPDPTIDPETAAGLPPGVLTSPMPPMQGPPSEDPSLIAADAMSAIGMPPQGPPMPPPGQVLPPEESQPPVMQADPNMAPPPSEAGSVDAALDQSNGGGLLARMMPDLTPDQRRQNLLAIGAGLLNGTDWSSGFAGAGQNLMQAGEQRMSADQRMQEILMQGALSEQRAAAAADNQGRFYQGSVIDANGVIHPNVWADRRTGEQFSVGIGGVETPVFGKELNNSTAAGTDQRVPAQQTVERLGDTRRALRLVESTLTNLDDVKQGIPGLIRDGQTLLQTLVNDSNLSPEQINHYISRGNMQGLIGALRTQVVGPGVMTEQDALRVAMFIGGDLSNTGQNRGVAQARLEQLYEQLVRAYEEDWSAYSDYRTRFGDTLVLPELQRWERGYTPAGSGALDGSNAGDPGTEDILKQYGM